MSVQSGRLGAAFLAQVEAALAPADALLSDRYPGDDGSRQPVHTVYVPADRLSADPSHEWGRAALNTAADHGGLAAIARATVAGTDSAATELADLVENKLRTEPIEDLRIDFEDGYGVRSDDEEDEAVAAAVAAIRDAGATSPPFIGIRFKCFEADVRARGLRTLDLFVSGLAETGDLPPGLALTLPKVTSVDQVAAMVTVAHELERVHGLPDGRIGFEIQVETPQAVMGVDGTAAVAKMIHAGAGRVTALHYGTYDYSASLGIAAAYQSMEHPAADHAKAVMQLAAAGTGVRLSDGSTNVLPVGDRETVEAGWALHSRLVRRHLERGIYQGWDLHPAQLVTRFLATYAFYRDGFDSAATRLRNYAHRISSSVLDEPATARALAGFIRRGEVCGALTVDEVESATDLPISKVRDLALHRPPVSGA
ncbi:aldolase/citrate lyase family protein [Gordonia amicalis]|uniref:Aldolase/citrate lyase family protein n=1 Tax=Gordonia amicalis TaxID=89053 RepID=A0ABU4DBG3_9ACTN|nr:aldolase/citrate lyase family protein [Gordonia amicalis]MDV6307072.1 aldolase/citrate lyase family protein [Gordonia amicalis]MDV7102322.1 aldolase/citrate lyase family protein [Gordonia amicalis]